MRTAFILWALGLTSIFSTCHRPLLGCPEPTYTFILHSRVYPDEETIRVGDTIWVEIQDSTVLMDQSAGHYVNFSDASNLVMGVGLIKRIGLNPIDYTGATSSFEFVKVHASDAAGTLPDRQRFFYIPQDGLSYHFKLGIIAKDTGTYCLVAGSSSDVSRRGEPCPKADFFPVMTQTQQHYSLGGINLPPSNSPNYYFLVKPK